MRSRLHWPVLGSGAALLLGAALLPSSKREPAALAASPHPGQPEQAGAGEPPRPDLRSKELGEKALYIPPQCYTKTRDGQGRIHNPCYVCHNGPQQPPNYVEDAELQLSFAFPEPARQNPWHNLFVDRSAALAVSDAATLAYVRTSNYLGPDGAPTLAQALRHPPAEWDADGDGHFAGYIPDAYFRFDAEGFDVSPSGVESGFRAYGYYPFPGTFWPTNGSAGDALIRLPEAFRKDESGRFDRTTYVVNLAVLEALIKGQDVAIAPVDERRFGVDLDRDGRLGRATRVRYDWAPLQKRFMSFVGQARLEQRDAGFVPAAGLFPVGTELLHSVRYLDLGSDGVQPAARFKELRYARKTSYRTYSDLELQALAEAKEDHDFPERLHEVRGDVEHGIQNGQGWIYQGFIEDVAGALRPQSYPESVFCFGCHSGIGATTDGVFSFARKLPSSSFQQGWFHFSQRSLKGTPEPKRRDGRGEYSYYLTQNRAGDELRENTEVLRQFFGEDGQPKAEALALLAHDIWPLLMPSPERAMALNKAYRAIVFEQSFVHGRDATLLPARNVHRRLEADEPTGIALALARR